MRRVSLIHALEPKAQSLKPKAGAYPPSFIFLIARLARLSGARGGVIAARCIRSIRRISISSGVGAGVRSS